MKKIFKIILQYYLKYIAKLVLAIHRPKIIAVAGSMNKSFFKGYVRVALEQRGVKVRSNTRSFNTEIGLPLAVLHLPSGYNEYKKWIPTILGAFGKIFTKIQNEALVLELGVSKKGDMKYLLSIIKPKIIIITDLTQRYIESFSDMNELFGEYQELVNTASNSIFILNADNVRIREIGKIALKKNQVCYFGIDKKADWEAKNIKKTADGIEFDAVQNDESNHYKINRFGLHHIQAKLASIITNNYWDKL